MTSNLPRPGVDVDDPTRCANGCGLDVAGQAFGLAWCDLCMRSIGEFFPEGFADGPDWCLVCRTEHGERHQLRGDRADVLAEFTPLGVRGAGGSVLPQCCRLISSSVCACRAGGLLLVDGPAPAPGRRGEVE